MQWWVWDFGRKGQSGRVPFHFFLKIWHSTLQKPIPRDVQTKNIEIAPAPKMSIMQRTLLPRHFCPSVKRVHCDKTKNRCPHSYTIWKKTIILVFLHRYTKTDWWGRPLVPEILGKPDPVRARRRFSIDICVTYTSINTNRKSATRCPMSLLINSVRCPEPSKKRLKDSKMAVFC